MSTNRKYARNSPLRVAVASPVVSNDPVVLGEMGGGVALTNYDADDGKATVDFEGVFLLDVKGVNTAGNVAVAAGDALYYVAGDTPVLSRKTTGVFFGYALEAVVGGATTEIMVRLAQGGGSGSFGSSGAYVSPTEVTATGSAQNIAHGLGVVPSRVVIVPTEVTSGADFDVAEGTHTTTNVVVTVTAGTKFKVIAWK